MAMMAKWKKFLLMSGNRTKVIALYKQLLYLGRDYPKGYDYFRERLKRGFLRNRDLTEASQVELALARGNYIVKELEALYMLRKYRALKNRYYSDDQ